MAYLNRCEIIGNTGKPATVVTLPSGGQKVLFSVAVSKKYRDKNGEQKVVYKTADLLQARDYAESLNEDFDDPDGAHYTVGMIKENTI